MSRKDEFYKIEKAEGTTRKVTVAEKMDGYQNLMTGLGTKKDKGSTYSMVYERPNLMELGKVFAGDRMARRICEIVPTYSLKKPPEFVAEDNSIVDICTKTLKRLRVMPKLIEAWIWANVYGGCSIVIGAEGNPEEPLPPNAKINFLRVFDRTQVNYVGAVDKVELQKADVDQKLLRDDLVQDHNSEDWGEPMFYMVTPINGTPAIYHHTRIIKIQGLMLPQREYIGNQYWGQSFLDGMLTAIQKYAGTMDAAATMVQDFRQAVYKLSNLDKVVGEEGEEALKSRVEMMDMVRSIVNAILIGDGEDFDIKGGGQTSGYGELVDKAIIRLVIESGITHTVLLGDSPSGLGATGESERLDFNSMCEAWREVAVGGALDRILNQELRANGKPEDSFESVWPSLWLMSPKEELEAKNSQADVDTKYWNMGLSEQVIFKSRFKETGYSYEMTIDPSDLEELEDQVPKEELDDPENYTVNN